MLSGSSPGAVNVCGDSLNCTSLVYQHSLRVLTPSAFEGVLFLCPDIGIGRRLTTILKAAFERGVGCSQAGVLCVDNYLLVNCWVVSSRRVAAAVCMSGSDVRPATGCRLSGSA
jgi:hypothetical protein